jgi:crotonobetainyl-CoA:carnitine CoA-transferase CaiB-like acyl-CoA transferase
VVPGLLDDVGVLLNLAGFKRADGAREALREADAADGQPPTQPNVTLNGAAGNLEQWEALCTTLGVDTSLNRSTAGAQLEMRFRTRTAVSWSYHLDDVGVPNEIAVDPKGGDLVLFDADNERLGLVSGYKHEIMGAVRRFGSTIDFSETPFRPHRPPPRIGRARRRSSPGSASTRRAWPS